MKRRPKTQTLPNRYAALRFVCKCFGLGEKDLADTLVKIRNATKEPNEHFPGKLSRMMLDRSVDEKSTWHDALVTLYAEALYQRIMRDNSGKQFSFTRKLTDELIVSLLSLYEQLRPKLDFAGLSAQETMWVLVEEVFVPTVFIKLVQEWPLGLGTEFQGEQCWYLPLGVGGHKSKPVARILDCWLRVAGFRTAYGVSQSLIRGKRAKSFADDQTDKLWQTWKKSVERWLNGEPVQSVQRLHRLVREFAGKVAWLDEPDNWQARFTLAFGMQKICEAMDDFFKTVCEDSSLTISGMLGRIVTERLFWDDNRILAGSHTFFAGRLLQHQLESEGKWKTIVAPLMPQKLSEGASDDEIEAYRSQIDRQMNPGNRLLDFIVDKGVSDGRLERKDSSVNSVRGYIALETYIFDLGVNELNRLLLLKRKGAGKQ